jgi:hypothetical protein
VLWDIWPTLSAVTTAINQGNAAQDVGIALVASMTYAQIAVHISQFLLPFRYLPHSILHMNAKADIHYNGLTAQQDICLIPIAAIYAIKAKHADPEDGIVPLANMTYAQSIVLMFNQLLQLTL